MLRPREISADKLQTRSKVKEPQPGAEAKINLQLIHDQVVHDTNQGLHDPITRDRVGEEKQSRC